MFSSIATLLLNLTSSPTDNVPDKTVFSSTTKLDCNVVISTTLSVSFMLTSLCTKTFLIISKSSLR